MRGVFVEAIEDLHVSYISVLDGSVEFNILVASLQLKIPAWIIIDVDFHKRCSHYPYGL